MNETFFFTRYKYKILLRSERHRGGKGYWGILHRCGQGQGLYEELERVLGEWSGTRILSISSIRIGLWSVLKRYQGQGMSVTWRQCYEQGKGHGGKVMLYRYSRNGEKGHKGR